jgi:hypothetical protein
LKSNDLNEISRNDKDCKEEYEDELEVENYSPHELRSKKRAISTRVAKAGVVVVVVIIIAGLIINIIYPDASHNVIKAIQNTTRSNYIVLGGSGSWILSRMERFDG